MNLTSLLAKTAPQTDLIEREMPTARFVRARWAAADETSTTTHDFYYAAGSRDAGWTP